ncbi:hypothetical protein DSL72_006720 [Monilinia vaccinii-corymbosi]|uniref:Uncharacterized protein n=1 Tax=Monilinia vaccinii-corymbosi TaxID=61207 RepID=A0A8A3PMZ0_9HELO|nr:hypothetical protein DSL72_006720 [Monilinia vaccinii-corymbosi]
MQRIPKEKREQLRSEKEKRGRRAVKEKRRVARAVRAQKESIPTAAAMSFEPNVSNQQEMVIRTRATANNSPAFNSGLTVSAGAAAARGEPATASPLPRANARRATSSARIAAAVVNLSRGRHHKRASVPSQKERLSRRDTFRKLTGLSLASLELGLNVGGSVAPDIDDDWPAKVLGEELRSSDDEEDVIMEEDDDDDDEMEDQDLDIYNSNGLWSALGVNIM